MGHKCNNYSDYGSGSSSSSSSWASQQDIRWPSFTPKEAMERPSHKSSSYSELVMGRCTLDDVMRDFHMNGSDSPYNPDEERIWKYSELSGMGPGGAYVRQKSWPAPERSPAPRLPRPQPEFTTSTPIFDEGVAPFTPSFEAVSPSPSPSPSPDAGGSLSEEQARVLGSLPVALLQVLLQQLHQEKRSKLFKVQMQVQECRFCANNGEREWYRRSHALKDALGRVTCPVLRAFRCARCGAQGDRAHTIKYCPLSTNEERIKSAAMMRSVRMASGRRRAHAPPPPAADDYLRGRVRTPAAAGDAHAHARAAQLQAPLDPLWAALEQKLML